MDTLPKYLTQEELKRFFAAIGTPRDPALFGVIYHYGLRVGEALMLTVDDVHFTNHRITIRRSKNGLGGEKPLWRHTAKLLRSYLRERRDVGPYLFTGRKGPLQKRQVQKLFNDYAKAAGIKERSVHALRHSMAVHLLEAGRGIEYVADHLGHKNIQNTRIYAQITNPLREQVFRELEQHPKIVRLS
jgi:integrase/recombinase XerD